MTQNQQKYGAEYKVQVIKLSKEIGSGGAVGYGRWRLYAVYIEELIALCKQVKEQDKKIWCLKEENEFMEKSSAFFADSHRKSARIKE